MLSKKIGFTLIELLVVIGIMAVISAGVIALIDPVEKTNQAKDATAQSILGQVATGMQSYAAQQSTGSYPATLLVLSNSGELPATLPYPDVNYTVQILGTGVAGTPGGAYTQLRSKKYYSGKCSLGAAPVYWFFTSTNGKACGSCTTPALTTACAAW